MGAHLMFQQSCYKKLFIVSLSQPLKSVASCDDNGYNDENNNLMHDVDGLNIFGK